MYFVEIISFKKILHLSNFCLFLTKEIIFQLIFGIFLLFNKYKTVTILQDLGILIFCAQGMMSLSEN